MNIEDMTQPQKIETIRRLMDDFAPHELFSVMETISDRMSKADKPAFMLCLLAHPDQPEDLESVLVIPKALGLEHASKNAIPILGAAAALHGQAMERVGRAVGLGPMSMHELVTKAAMRAMSNAQGR